MELVHFFRRFRFAAWVILVLSAIIVALFYQALKPQKVLPVYQPAMVAPELVDESIQYVKKYHTIAPFSMTNQNGETITEQDYDNVIYVADFFFTTCGNICPKMTGQMKILHDTYINDDDLLFLSHTVYPEEDSVAVLRAYAEKYVIDSKKWLLLTGDKRVIYDLARKSYFAVLTEGDGGERDFIHTENFMLMDKKQRIRGYYDGTSPEDMERLKEDIEILRLEYV